MGRVEISPELLYAAHPSRMVELIPQVDVLAVLSYYCCMEPAKMQKIRQVMQHHPVRQAFLFGSQAHGTAGPLSDIDIAVVFEPASNPDQAESHLFAELSQALQTDNIDIINLVTASPLLAHRAVLRGLELFSNSRHDQAILKTNILHAYEDTRHLREIKQAAFI